MNRMAMLPAVLEKAEPWVRLSHPRWLWERHGDAWRLDTPDGPYIVATIGHFPSDLDGRRQEFLGGEFFEHFAKDVLEIGDPDSSAVQID